MENNTTNFKILLFGIILCSFSCLSLAQTDNTKKQVEFVFDQLIPVYGSAKTPPKLELIEKGKYPVLPASYTTKNGPTIKIDKALYKLCQTFGKDSLNALAMVISHELTHYFNDHTFCSDYAFANFKKNNPELGKVISKASFDSRKEKEFEADAKGFFFAAAAGFEPYSLQGLLIDKIYKAYKLSDKQEGYPSRKERIEIAQSAEKTAKELYDDFKKGLLALENKQYDDAIKYFENANGKIPFRENFNNLGVAKTLKALELKVPDDIEKQFPNRFTYPIEIDNKSRLKNERTRALDDSEEEVKVLLRSAQKDFEKAISLDTDYTKGFINLACVFDLLENPNAAIGKIKELSKENQNNIAAKRILAIAYSRNKQNELANEIWKELKM